VISINNPALSTAIFTSLIIVSLLVVRKKTSASLFPRILTEELKGFAILTIVFSHIGYFLSSNDSFLYPLSTMAGVGVNLFLFLSGYGLSVSSLKKPTNTKTYLQRLLRLFVPFWIVVITYFLLDYFVLHIDYTHTYIIRSFVGIFPHADLVHDVNSVLWYFSLILFYYLVFPLVFIKKHLWISALILFIALTFIVRLDPAAIRDVLRLYRVHTLAFPLGMLVAWFAGTSAAARFKTRLLELNGRKKTKLYGRLRQVNYLFGLILLACLIGYTAIHSNVGSTPIKEQATSLISMFLVIAFFVLKKFRFGLLSLFGYVSYEIYLIHWPLLSRYDFLYNHSPAWLATILYLGIFLVLGWLLKTMTELLFTIIQKRPKHLA
jgi:peptidoglycan/LPS O-acetylase OafA/YrhL